MFRFPDSLQRPGGRPTRGRKPAEVRRRAPRAVDRAGNRAGELLSDGVDQQRRAVADDDSAVDVQLGCGAKRRAATNSVKQRATRWRSSPESRVSMIVRRRGSRDAEHSIGVHRVSGLRLLESRDDQQTVPVYFE